MVPLPGIIVHPNGSALQWYRGGGTALQEKGLAANLKNFEWNEGLKQE